MNLSKAQISIIVFIFLLTLSIFLNPESILTNSLSEKIGNYFCSKCGSQVNTEMGPSIVSSEEQIINLSEEEIKNDHLPTNGYKTSVNPQMFNQISEEVNKNI